MLHVSSPSKSCRRRICLRRLATVGVLLLFALPIHAQVDGGFSLVASFGGSKGSAKVPCAPVIQGADGNFFGTTQNGGGGQAGTVFSLTPGGTLSRFYRFRGGDGAVPTSPVVTAATGTLYGTTEQGGYYDHGTVFRLTTDGALTVLHDFGSRDDGITPEAALVLGADGFFYGTTSRGGYHDGGTVFRLAADGSGYTILYDFGSSYDDAAVPNAALYAGSDGRLYGTTTYGGYSDRGTVFQITTDGTLTILHDFRDTDGAYPNASLVEGDSGGFYGTTSGGGSVDAGTVFRIAANGTHTLLSDFPDKVDGLQPEAALIKGTDGNFYGTTYYGGTAGGGTVFRLNGNGAGFTTLHSFVGGSDDGANPAAALLQAADGTFYGTTAYGGANRVGTVFRLALGLTTPGPIVAVAQKGRGTATFGVRNARFLVSRTAGDVSQPLLVYYTLDGTAVNGVDYQRLPGYVVIPAGAVSVRVAVKPLVAETESKTVYLTLYSPQGLYGTTTAASSAAVEIVP